MLALLTAVTALAQQKEDSAVARSFLGVGMSILWLIIFAALLVGIALLPRLFRNLRR